MKNNHHFCSNSLSAPVRTVVLISLILLYPAAVLPARSLPLWDNVPKPLKQEAGISEGTASGIQWIFATGKAAIENIRPDKALELALKKSRLRAFQMLYAGGVCGRLLDGLDKKERGIAISILESMLPKAGISGVSVIRQWSDAHYGFTTVAAPEKSFSGLNCPFESLADAANQYARQDGATLDGLYFCLCHVSWYSAAARDIRQMIGEIYQTNGAKAQADCLLSFNLSDAKVNPLIFQMNLQKADIHVKNAEALAAKDDWNKAIPELALALKFVPTHAPAYLLMGNYFADVEHRPALARCAAQKALMDGACFNQGIQLMIRSLKSMGSPEAEVYEYVLAKTTPDHIGYPFDFASDYIPEHGMTIPYLVLNSAGNALGIKAEKPGKAYRRAVDAFNNAHTDADLKGVIALLFSAADETPAAPEIYNLCGACFRNLKQPVAALPFLWQALNLKPGYDLAITNLGLCCKQLGLKNAAKFYFDQPAVKNSANKWVKSMRGNVED